MSLLSSLHDEHSIPTGSPGAARPPPVAKPATKPTAAPAAKVAAPVLLPSAEIKQQMGTGAARPKQWAEPHQGFGVGSLSSQIVAEHQPDMLAKSNWERRPSPEKKPSKAPEAFPVSEERALSASNPFVTPRVGLRGSVYGSAPAEKPKLQPGSQPREWATRSPWLARDYRGLAHDLDSAVHNMTPSAEPERQMERHRTKELEIEAAIAKEAAAKADKENNQHARPADPTAASGGTYFDFSPLSLMSSS